MDKGYPQPEPCSNPQEAGIFRGDDKAPTEVALTALALQLWDGPAKLDSISQSAEV